MVGFSIVLRKNQTKCNENLKSKPAYLVTKAGIIILVAVL